MNKLIAGFSRRLLALLGIGVVAGSCIPMCMYGCPHSDYRVSGKVTDKDGKPIEGISVRQYQSSGPTEDGTAILDGWESEELTTTLSDGTFLIERELTSFGGDEELIFRDIDGEANGGEFEDKPVKITPKQVKKGDGSWYGGSYEAKDVNVVLEIKK